MRLDRLLTLAMFHPLVRFNVRNRRERLPVLMYHGISPDPDTRAPYFQTLTHPEVFAEQIEFLRNAGYTGVTLSEGLGRLQAVRTSTSSRPAVAITFDDGFRDFLTEAVPVLRRHGFRATMYLPTAFIGHTRQRFKERECLTWAEIKGLHAEGFEFGSHTVSHPRLVDLDWSVIRAELTESRRSIEEQLGAPVTAFAYPYAFPQTSEMFVSQFGRLLKETGYRSCVTTMIGRVRAHDDRLHLRRLPVNSCDDVRLLRAKLEGAYDWVGMAQGVLKGVRGIGSRTRSLSFRVTES